MPNDNLFAPVSSPSAYIPPRALLACRPLLFALALRNFTPVPVGVLAIRLCGHEKEQQEVKTKQFRYA